MIIVLDEKLDLSVLESRVVHYYIDKKGYSKEKANAIAQKVVEREKTRRICKNIKCKHLMDDHIRTKETCLVLDCDCRHFVS